MLKAVIKKRAYENIVEQIQALIKKGKLKQGDQLPNERELSGTFKVSRATVREAALSLETLKLVSRRQGHGTYVIASRGENLVQPLAASFFHEKDNLIDIFSVRKIIEPEISHLAAENRTPAECKKLGKILREQERRLTLGENPVQSDINFHQLLARATRNKVLERFQLALSGFLRKTRQAYHQSEERKQRSLRGHQNILVAIKSGNGRTARQAMRRHLEDVEGILFNKERGSRKVL